MLLKKILAAIGFTGSLMTLVACSGSTLLNATIPTDGYHVEKNIAYGTQQRQMLDIYIPARQDDKKTVLLFFYGGSWQFGSKDDYLFIGQAFAELGYVTVIADYRLYPQVKFPAFINDGATAVAWTHNHISSYGGNPERIFVSGHSAGGYIAAMLATNPAYIQQAGGTRDWIKGFIGIAAPLDFLPLTDPAIIDIFSTAEKPQDNQPITFADKETPPTLLLHGTADEDVWLKNSVNFASKISAAGGDDVIVKPYEDIGHIGIIISAARGLRWKTPLLDDIKEFISKY